VDAKQGCALKIRVAVGVVCTTKLAPPGEDVTMRAFQRGESQMQPVLKEIVFEASRALARLDADRLEELALSCQALNRDYSAASLQDRSLLAAEARETNREMKVFSRILDMTQANLGVLDRSRERQSECLEYGQPVMRLWNAENGHGDN